MTEEQKKRIEDMAYIEMLRMWRHGADDELLFQGEAGDYFAEVMFAKKSKLSSEDRVAASKTVGW